MIAVTLDDNERVVLLGLARDEQARLSQATPLVVYPDDLRDLGRLAMVCADVWDGAESGELVVDHGVAELLEAWAEDALLSAGQVRAEAEAGGCLSETRVRQTVDRYVDQSVACAAVVARADEEGPDDEGVGNE